jgi:PAS domain S-box-containing protein
MNQPPPARQNPSERSVPLRVTLVYAAFASLWIVTSDLLVGRFAHGLDSMVGAGIFKGLFFVLVTSVLLFLTVRRYTEALRRSREDLHEREQTYRAVFEASNDGLCIEQLDGTILHANPTFCRMHGYALEELTGKKTADLAHPDHHHLLARTGTQLDQPGGYQHQALHLRRDGTALVVDVNVSRLTHRGEPCILSVVRDITDRLNAENELRESQRFLRAALDAMLTHVAILDEQGRVLTVNAAWRRFADEYACPFHRVAVGGDYVETCRTADGPQPGDGPAIAKGIQDVLARRRDTFSYEYDCSQHCSNHCFDVRVSRFEEPGPTRVVVAHVDVTDRKHAEEALRLSEQQFRTLFDHAPEAIFVVDAEAGRFIDANENAMRLFKIPREKLQTMGPADFSPPLQPDGRSSREAIADYDAQVFAGNAPVFEWIHRTTTGGEFPCEVRLVRLPAANRTIIRASITDITERKRAQEAIARQTQELARSNAELERFAYVASHDLQEPLRMVSSYTQLLARRYKGRLDADADEFIAYTVDGVTQMQTLISDLLTYSRVGSQGRPPTATPVTPALDRALANLQLAIQESAAVITHDPLPEVMADQVQLIQLFQNLVGNAVKFRRDEPPRVHISARREGQEWVFAITDNGIGIESEFFERIFVIFQRLHPRAKYAGTGIGLTICKRIIERHGGRIWVESQPGRGSTFFFSLPAVPDEHT